MLRASILASIALLALIAPASAFDLVVVNEASFSAIHKLYLAPAKSNACGEDKLGLKCGRRVEWCSFNSNRPNRREACIYEVPETIVLDCHFGDCRVRCEYGNRAGAGVVLSSRHYDRALGMFPT